MMITLNSLSTRCEEALYTEDGALSRKNLNISRPLGPEGREIRKKFSSCTATISEVNPDWSAGQSLAERPSYTKFRNQST